MFGIDGDWVINILSKVGLFFDGIAFQLASYAYKLFSLVTQFNFNSVYAIVSPVVDRMQALIIVLVAYNLIMNLIGLLLKPESLPAKGKDLLKNIFITVALMLSYNLIFTVMNEISMLIIGTPPGYSFTVLNELADVSGGGDVGLIQRFVFGEETDIGDAGDYIAYETMSVFLKDTTGTSDNNDIIKAISEGDGYNFLKVSNVSNKVGKNISYFPFVGLVTAGFLVYTFVKLSLEVGIRVFKLLVLQMVAPIVIISIIKDGVKNKTTTNYLKQYWSAFSEVFIRVLSTLIVTVFITKAIANIKSLFGDATAIGDEWYTTGFLTIIIIVAGYKFVLELPKFLGSVINMNVDVAGMGFGNYLSGLVGGAAGFAVGAVGGAAAGGGFFGRAGGALVGGLSGLGQGAYTAGKGGKIADSIKNGTAGANARSENWKNRGGFSNVVIGGASDISGNTRRQDKQMEAYQGQMDAVNAYAQAEQDYAEAIEQAQINGIKDTTMSTSDTFAIRDGQTGEELRLSADEIYSSGYEQIKLGENENSYVQSMLEYDKEYQQTQAALDAARTNGDATAIANAQRKNIEARNDATKRAKEYWESKKSEVDTSSVDSSKRDEALSKANKALGNEEGTAIDVKTTRKEIVNKQKEIQQKRSYQSTHPKGSEK